MQLKFCSVSLASVVISPHFSMMGNQERFDYFLQLFMWSQIIMLLSLVPIKCPHTKQVSNIYALSMANETAARWLLRQSLPYVH